MNDRNRTLIYIAVAMVLTLGAWLAQPRLTIPEAMRDVGEMFFASFTDPDQASALEVIRFDRERAREDVLRVENRRATWVIPSHHDYPAGNINRLTETAQIFIGLTKDDIRSNDPADHQQFGVIDPRNPAIEDEGRGTLVRFLDRAGNELAGLIVGRAVPDRSGFRFVRLPDRDRVYVARIGQVPSTRFVDWIERSILDIHHRDINRIILDDYRIDARQLQLVNRQISIFERQDDDWTMEDLPEGREIDQDRIDRIARDLANMRIVGVRPMPPRFADLLSGRSGQITEADMFSLAGRGYVLDPRTGDLMAMQGTLTAFKDDGTVLLLYFGRSIPGEGRDVTAGSEDEETFDPLQEDEAEPDTNDALNRFVIVRVVHDPELADGFADQNLTWPQLQQRFETIEAIEEVRDAVDRYRFQFGRLPETLQQLAELTDRPLTRIPNDAWGNPLQFTVDGPSFELRSLGADGQEGGEDASADILLSRLADERALTRVARAARDAQRMADRLSGWYFVISDSTFQSIRPAPDQLTREPAPESTPGSTPGGAPENGDETVPGLLPGIIPGLDDILTPPPTTQFPADQQNGLPGQDAQDQQPSPADPAGPAPDSPATEPAPVTEPMPVEPPDTPGTSDTPGAPDTAAPDDGDSPVSDAPDHDPRDSDDSPAADPTLDHESPPHAGE